MKLNFAQIPAMFGDFLADKSQNIVGHWVNRSTPLNEQKLH
jgi:hypothetical protein